MKVSRWILIAGAVAIVLAVALAGSLAVSKAPAASKAIFKSALLGDQRNFNDKFFLANQLKGLKYETKLIGGKYHALGSNSSADYTPNYNTAVNVDHANIVIAASFLLGDTMQTWAHAYPGTQFAITDVTATFVGHYANEAGITYATEQGGCLVGLLAAKWAKMKGTKVIGVVGGIEIPAVNRFIAGYEYCAQKAVPGTHIVVQYSNDFVNQAACATLAQNEISIQHAQVIFQVAGPCGDGALTAAASLGKMGIGLAANEYNVAPGHILTSALLRTDLGVEKAISNAYHHTWHGGKDIVMNLLNHGVGVGTISPLVPAAWKDQLTLWKELIIAGDLNPPTVCAHPHCAT